MEIQINDKIVLQRLAVEQAPAIFELIEANRSYFQQWLPWPDMPLDVADTQAFLQQRIARFEAGQGPQFAIKFDGKICGLTGFHQLDPADKVGSIGYWIGKAFGKKGIVTQAATRVMQIGFTEYALDTIEIKCAVNNHNSRAVAERLGFTQVDTLLQAIQLNGQDVDLAVYALSATA